MLELGHEQFGKRLLSFEELAFEMQLLEFEEA